MNKTISSNNVVSRIVCWKCGHGGERGDAPLKKVSETNYVCLNDLAYGAPDKEHQSEVFFKKEIEKEAIPSHDKHT